MLQKLARFGFDAKFLKFFASYLVDRQQILKIADSYSTSQKFQAGFPQGSIFAVFFFSVNINDLPDQSNNKTFLYADDTKIMEQISEREELQFDINRALEWSGSNRLNFNFDKFGILEFSSHTKIHIIRLQKYLQYELPSKTKNKLKISE